ncbi:PREDICTED: uncharacterized protein LOC106751358, partial [Dinoponera quadriceps]|uniref:Uncharacterized protein LOC106751358 n=1 Tax=Dinoponera quadriceps TaxID=609295 RepID=A0A6P3Y9M2_DINQU
RFSYPARSPIRSYNDTESRRSYSFRKISLDEDTMMQFFIVQVLQPALHNDVELRVPPVVHEYDPFYASLIYKKGENVLTSQYSHKYAC